MTTQNSQGPRSNPLFTLQHQHGPLPFDAVQPDDFLPALDAALADARTRLDRIRTNTDGPTWENTVVSLEAIDEWADRVSAMFYHLLEADGGPEMHALAKEIPPRLSAFRSDIAMDADLFQRLRDLHSRMDALDLTTEERTVLENHYLCFTRNGALLNEAEKIRLRAIDERLSICGPGFSEHVLKETQAYTLWISDADAIQQLPSSAREAAQKAATDDGRESEWKFTLDAPSYVPFMTYYPDENKRQELWRAFCTRCVEGEHGNGSLLREILTLRYERAQLLGYQDHAAYVLERRMAGTPETVEAFFAKMTPKVLPAAKRDLEAVRALKEEETGEAELHPWDYGYFCERLKRKTFDLDEEELRPYFAYEQTLDSIFRLTGRLFDLRYEAADDVPVYQDDVRAFRVRTSEGCDVGLLYIDPHPRPTKRNGAWMVDLLGQGLWDGEVRRPHVGIVCNFTPSIGEAPALLTFNEARTLFHEFGHALHELLSQCRYRSVSGVNVFWDFVELPSQLLENWLGDPEALRELARHHKTGEAMPEALIEKIQRSQTFQKGYQAARQLSFGLLDLAWHRCPPESIGDDLLAFERNATEDLRMFPPQPGTAFSHSFQHIFSGG